MKSHAGVSILFLVSALLGGCLGRVGGKHSEITVQEVQAMLSKNNDVVVLDVRERSEYCSKEGHIPGAMNYPWNSKILHKRYTELGVSDAIVIVCRSGRRSHEAADYLQSKGFLNVYDVAGGMNAWKWKTTGCRDSETLQRK
jgi:rhodanese-related sulfurtransferase